MSKINTLIVIEGSLWGGTLTEAQALKAIKNKDNLRPYTTIGFKNVTHVIPYIVNETTLILAENKNDVT